MANEIWDLSRKTMIFYDKGKGDPRTGPSKKMVQAPFSLVNVHGNDTALVPNDSHRVSMNNDKDYFMGTDTPSGIQGQVFPESEFFFDGSTIVIGEHEMGDFKGQPENWKGLHKFAAI